MKRRITYMVLSCLMVVTLVLSACQPAPVTETEETQEVKGEVTQTTTPATPSTPSTTTTPAGPEGPEMVANSVGTMVEKPQYGGTFTYRIEPTWMVFYDLGGPARRHTAASVYDRLMEPDFAKGPAGTGDLRFITSSYAATDYAGMLAESWEIVDLHTIIYHIREGVRWQDVAPVNGREFVAEDVTNYIDWRIQADREQSGDETIYSDQEDWIADRADDADALAWVAEIEELGVELWSAVSPNESYWHAPDKYTLIYKTYNEKFNNVTAGSGFLIWPHELWETYPEEDLNDFDKQCGTGPYYVVDHVSESSMTFTRNSNYFKMDPLHPENQLPYVQTVIALAIPDQSTYMAAIRTHKIDYASMGLSDALTLIRSNPELLYDEFLPPTSNVTFVRNDIEPFNDVRVRRAMMMALDHEAIADELYDGHATILTWPIMPQWRYSYTPLEELPESARKLYEYHPDEAKQLMIDAGYPNGFKTSIYSWTYPSRVESMLIIKEYLAEIDIDVTVVPMQGSEYVSLLLNTVWLEGDPFEHMMLDFFNNSQEYYPFSNYLGGVAEWETGRGSGLNLSRVDDQEFRDLFAVDGKNYYGILDEMERYALIKALNVKAIEQVYVTTLPMANNFVFWGPWVKRCDGAFTMGIDELTQSVAIKYYWVDQDVKYEITGQRD